MAKDYVIDGGTGELDVGGNALAQRFDLPEAMVPQNLGQRFNLGGLVRPGFYKAQGPRTVGKYKDMYVVEFPNKKGGIQAFKTLEEANEVIEARTKIPRKPKGGTTISKIIEYLENVPKGQTVSMEDIVKHLDDIGHSSKPGGAIRYLRNPESGKYKGKGGIDKVTQEKILKLHEKVDDLYPDYMKPLHEGGKIKDKKTIAKITELINDPAKYKTKESVMKALGYKTDPRPGKTYGMGSFNKLLKSWEKATGDTLDMVKRFPETFRYKGSQIAADIINEVKTGLAKGETLNVKRLAKKHLKDLFITDEAGARRTIRTILAGEIDIDWDARENIAGENTGAKNVRARRIEKIKAAAKLAGKDAVKQVNSLILDVEDLNNTYRHLAQTDPEKILNNKKLIDALSVTFDVETGKVGRKTLSRDEILRLVDDGIFELEHIRPVHTVKFEPGKTVAKKVVAGHAVGWPTNLQITTRNMNGQFLNNVENYMLHNKLDVLPENAAEVLKNQELRTYVSGKYHGAGPGVGWNSKDQASDIFKRNLNALDLTPDQKLFGDKFLKKAGNVVKPILKYAGKVGAKVLGSILPIAAPAGIGLGLFDMNRARAEGLNRPQELGAAYYLGPSAAQGMRNITEYDYKDRAGKEWENIKESWSAGPTGVTEDISEQVEFAGGGSVEPRVAYRDGTRMSAQPPKEKSYEDILKELQIQYNIPNEEGFAVKDKLGRLGDIVDPRNYPYYGSKVGKGIMEAAEFSVRFPGAAGQLIHDVATGPGWKEQGLDFIKNVSPGWGWSEKVGLDSLIDEQVGAMKERGASDAPASLGGVLNLGADIAMPLGYVYGAAKFAKFMKALGQTPDKISDFNKKIIDHLDSTGQSKRDFMTLVGTVGAMGAIKAMGLDKVFKMGKVTKGVDDMIPMLKGTESIMPKWFPMFIQRIQPKLIYEGDGISTFKGTDDFLPGIEVTKIGDDYTVSGTNAYEGSWNINYEGPRWLEIEPGQKPTYFKGEFQVADDAPHMVDPDGGVHWEQAIHKEVDDILGGNGRSMEEFATSKKIEGLTKGEQKVDWAEGRAQYEADMAREAEGGLTKLDDNEWLGNYVDDRMPDDF